jgi:hypothetical protein
MSGPGLDIKITTQAKLDGLRQAQAAIKQQIAEAERASSKLQGMGAAGQSGGAAAAAGAKTAAAGIGGMTGAMSLATKQAIAMWTAITGGVAAAIAALAGMMKGLGGASRLEDMEASFVTLMGSVSAAKERLQELKQFTDTTPFEFEEVANASRVLQNLAGDALSTGDGLRMIGDVAAATDVPFRELAVTVGRYYQALQNGAPVGEMAGRLTEITGINFRQVKSWDEAQAAFSRYAGEMDRRSKTTSSWWLGFKEQLGNVGTEIGKPLMDVLKPVLQILTTLTGFLAQALAKANELRDKLKIRSLIRVGGERPQEDASTGAAQSASTLATAQNDVADSSASMRDRVQSIIEPLNQMGDAADRARARINGLEQAQLALRMAEIDLQEKTGDLSPASAKLQRADAQAAAQNSNIDREMAAAQAEIEAAMVAQAKNSAFIKLAQTRQIFSPDDLTSDDNAMLAVGQELAARIADAEAKISVLNTARANVALGLQAAVEDFYAADVAGRDKAGDDDAKLAVTRRALEIELELSRAKAQGNDAEAKRLEYIKQYKTYLEQAKNAEIESPFAYAKERADADAAGSAERPSPGRLIQSAQQAIGGAAGERAVDVSRALREAIKTNQLLNDIKNKEPVVVDTTSRFE